MTRTVLTGGVVFDGTGTAPSPADVAIQDGHVVEVGSGLAGVASIDCTDKRKSQGQVAAATNGYEVEAAPSYAIPRSRDEVKADFQAFLETGRKRPSVKVKDTRMVPKQSMPSKPRKSQGQQLYDEMLARTTIADLGGDSAPVLATNQDRKRKP